MKKLLINNITFIKYAIVGILGTAIDVFVLYLFYELLNLNLYLSLTIAFFLAVINNFTLNKIWTFQNKSKNLKNQFFKFFIVSIVGLSLTYLFMYFFVSVFGIYHIFAKLMTSVLVLTWNFIGNKFWSFKITQKKNINLNNIFDYDLSVIIPSYNEEERIIPTIKSINNFFKNTNIKTEIILVDDGSSDNTYNVVKFNFPEVKSIRYTKNKGKGYAVKTGVFSAKGKYILFTDADNSTPIEEFNKLWKYRDDFELIIGSRYLDKKSIKIKQSLFRVIISRLGNKLISLFLIDGIKDTQCGFKLFSHNEAKNIFSLQKIHRFGFDMEVLLMAKMFNYKIKEVPVNWYNDDRSRMRSIKDSLQTLFDLLIIKLNYWFGKYN